MSATHMSIVVYQSRTRDDLYEALQRLIDGCWGRTHGTAAFSIPCDELRDAGCILADGINELQLARWKIEKLEKRIAELEAQLPQPVA